ncbi:metallophosphoesterase [Paenibacillus sp. Marseille-P2973]|uniref:metallophosphoesterase family protein n=1 Tax=Paenibacillus sp. Marseille-P2973 TaxID=1871032 RepID=UPI001B391367|nr:metallophosphoesterase [Paenibacillus sp. Marseille-P2973]MBQ4901248.1 metallophosphoesterase [Paenibacillus sp. Marseille-P2973]
MEVNFVHISDLHLHFKNYDSEKMRRELVTYISELSNTINFDMLIVTGDLTHKGGKFTPDITEFLNSLIDSMKISKEKVYIVPGNHDLKRDDVRGLMIEGIKNIKSGDPSDQLDKAIATASPRNTIYKSFNGFFKFYKQLIGEEYPKNEVHFIRNSEKCNIVHINTCLVAYTANEEKTLLVAKQKLLACLNKLEGDSSKLNIAIGHHTIECMSDTDKKALQNNFDDYRIDLYLSGHVHQANYDIEANGNNQILHIVSGAGLVDSYANGGFVTAKISTSNAKAEIQYHSWSQDNSYWKINNDVGRKAKTGTLCYDLIRFQKKPDLTSSTDEGFTADDFNEDEFKRFIIDLHQHPQKKGSVEKYKMKQEQIERKFEKMNCSDTFEQLFLGYTIYFSAIDEIMSTTSYIELEKKEIVSEIIIDAYMGIHNKHSNGDEIFREIVELLYNSPQMRQLPYTPNQAKRYIRILVAWVIYDCGIFNETKNKVEVNT